MKKILLICIAMFCFGQNAVSDYGLCKNIKISLIETTTIDFGDQKNKIGKYTSPIESNIIDLDKKNPKTNFWKTQQEVVYFNNSKHNNFKLINPDTNEQLILFPSSNKIVWITHLETPMLEIFTGNFRCIK